MNSTHRSSPWLVLVLLLGACASTGDEGTADTLAEANAIKVGPPGPIGKFLADTDSTISRWNNLTLTAKSSAELRQARILEQVLIDQTTKRRAELIHELEVGPPINRIRAAAALGFTHSVEAQSPLLAALHDPHPDVVHNALLGLALLDRADTPLEEICKLAERSPDGETRAQAAYALRAILGAGGSGECAIPTARRGLVDTDAFVRSQCALALGLAGDAPSIPALGDLLYDDANLVSQAAAQALVLIAKDDAGQKGKAGRALVAAFAKDRKDLKARAKEALVQIADVNYGDDLTAWTEWSERLP